MKTLKNPVLDRVVAVFNAIRWGSMHPRDPGLAEWFGGSNTISGAHVTSDTAMRVATVYACVSKISKTMATMPLILYREDKTKGVKTRDLMHPLYKMLYCRPNRMQTSFDWVFMMHSHLMLRGNAYSYIQPGPAQGIQQLIPLHPDRVRPFWVDQDNFTFAYEYSPPNGGQPVVLLPSEVLHLRDWAPDGLTGLSRITQHRETVGFAMTLGEHGARLFANGVQSSGVLKHPGELGDNAFTRLKKQWAERYSGAKNAGTTIILEEGMSFEQLSMTNVDAQYIEQQKFTRSQICSLFDTPPHMIGDLDRATFSNIEQQSLEFAVFTMLPWVRNWEQALERDVIYDPAQCVRFMMQGLVRGDMGSRYKSYAIGRQWGWLSANDVRRLEDQDPIPDGDIYLTPMNMVPAGIDPMLYLNKGNANNAQTEDSTSIPD